MNAPGRDRAAGAAGAAACGAGHHGRGGASWRRSATSRGIAREKAAIFQGLTPGGVAVLNRDTPTYPILLAAARRAGARPVRFGASGRPEFRLGEVKVGEAGTCVAARAHGRPFLFRLGRAGAAPGDERARRARRGGGAGRRRRAGGAGARAMAGAGGPRGALDGAARAGRAGRRDHADRRELQRQPGGDGGGASRSSPASGRWTGSAGSRAGGASPSSATCWSSGRASASCTPGSRGCRRSGSVTTVHCAGAADAGAATRRCRGRSAASGSRTPRRWRRGRGGWSTPATSPWSRARAARGSAQVVEAIKAMGDARPAEAAEG